MWAKVFIIRPPPVLLSLLICRSSRSSVDEEVAPLDDGQSDDDILANSSDEEEDSSSLSSKGEAERPEESPVRADLHHSVLIFHLGFLIFLTSLPRCRRDRRVRFATSPPRLWPQRACKTLNSLNYATQLWPYVNSWFSLFFRFVDVLKLLHVVSIHTVDSDIRTVCVFCVSMPSPTASTRAKARWPTPHVVSLELTWVLINVFNEEQPWTFSSFCTKEVTQMSERSGVRCWVWSWACLQLERI